MALIVLRGGVALGAGEPSPPLRGPAPDALAWPTTLPEAAGFDTQALDELLTLIADTPPRDFRALVIARHGELVLNETFNSFARTNVHDIRSAGKSVTSMLAGIASDRGLIDVDAPI
ncbi:MAG: hypothetical protein AAFX85_04885, partial [Pseudomonadota bacterium]